MRWAIAILWVTSLAAYAGAETSSFQKLVLQAEQARQADRLFEAAQLYRKAVQLRPNWSEGWWWLGSIYYDQDLYTEARSAFEHSISGSKKDATVYAFLGLCEYEQRDYPAARADLRKWIVAGATGDPQLVSAARFRWEELLIQDGHFLEALFQLNKEVRARGPNPSLEEAMGLAWMQMKNVPEDYPAEKREMVWLAGSAAAWMSASKMDRAKEFLDRLAIRYGDRPNVHFLRGFAFESLKDTEAAIAEYSQEVKIAPQAVTPVIQLALLYSDAGRQEEALEAARRAVALDPASARSHFALGRALLALQKWSESASELEKARDLSPEAAKIHFQLSRAYRKLGRTQDAEREEATFEALSKKMEDERPASEDPASLNQEREGRSR